jgi:hypothetical protein
MANSRDLGHAMRRRMGTPSSYTESLEPSSGQMMPTLDQHYEVAKSKTSSRVSLGEGPIDTPHEVMSHEQDAPSELGEVNTHPVGERSGAMYRVTSDASHFADPTHGPTTARGRIVVSGTSGISSEFFSSVQSSEE